MALNTTLANLLVMLKAEIGNALTAGIATADDAVLRVLLSNKQKYLSYLYDFVDLELRVAVTATAATRTFNFPTSLDVNRPVKIFTKLTVQDLWRPMDYGVDEPELSLFNSDAGVTADPIRKWQFYGVDGSGNRKVQVWPIPTTDQYLLVDGQIVLPSLAVDSDKAAIDDLMLVLFVAADRLTRTDQSDASTKLQQAQTIAVSLSRTSPKRDPVFSLGGDRYGQRRSMTVYVP